jgi:hypothetical protein
LESAQGDPTTPQNNSDVEQFFRVINETAVSLHS